MTEMRDVDHTHPTTAAPFGDAFRRGLEAADGGEREAADDASTSHTTSGETASTMEEVDHTSTDEGVDRTFERGTEGRSEGV
jgi:hypothetical protein